MFFCKSCSRLLDEDLKICPYCGAVEDESILDHDWVKEEIKAPDEALNKAPDAFTPSLDMSFSSPITSDNSLDETINKINEMIEKNQQDIAESFGGSEENKLDFRTFGESASPSEPLLPPPSAAPHPGSKPRPSAPEEYEDVPTGMKVGLILLSFIPVIGIIFGAIYMGKKNPKYKSFGKIVLIISIIATVLVLMCCCSLFFLAFATNLNY